jgi:D-alanyl-D-alanine carboxypeptidase
MLGADHVRIGSVTKAFVTTLLLRLDQEGRLSLDDPISEYIAGVPNGDAITLRQLANMTSGLADYFSNDQFSFEYLTGETFTPAHLLELGLELPPLYAPDTAWSYSNTNTTLLGLVIERVTGEPLSDALRQRVFGPLGLRGTSLPSKPALPKPFAYGYTEQTINGRLGDATFATPTSTWAAGGIVSTVRDLLRAAPMFGTGRPLLSGDTQAKRERWVKFAPNGPGQRYGIGVFSFNGWIGHNGGIPGYTAIAWHLPQRGLSLVVSVNSDIRVGPKRPGYAYEPASEIAHELTRILSPNHVAPAAVRVR